MRKIMLLLALTASFFTAYAGNPVKILVHRGLCSSGDKFVTDENTLDALSRAQAKAVDGIEFDVHMTKDGGLVIRHDNKITSNLSCQESTLAEIQEYTLPYGNKIPTLQQWLDQALKTPKIKMMLEIKDHKTAELQALVIEKSLKEIKDRNMLDQMRFLTFSPQTADELLRQEPSAKVILNSSSLHHSMPPAEVKEHGYYAVSYNVSVILNHMDWLKEFKEYGIETYLWMVNDVYLRNIAEKEGFNWVTTDFYDVVAY